MANCLVPTWIIIITISFAITIIVLIWLLLRREKALQLVKFSLSPTGIKLTLQLNVDKKLELLALENNVLRQEILVLKSENSRIKFNNIFTVIILVLFIITSKLSMGKSSKKIINV